MVSKKWFVCVETSASSYCLTYLEGYEIQNDIALVFLQHKPILVHGTHQWVVSFDQRMDWCQHGWQTSRRGREWGKFCQNKIKEGWQKKKVTLNYKVSNREKLWKKNTMIKMIFHQKFDDQFHFGTILFSFYKNIFYKNIKAEICEILRIF